MGLQQKKIKTPIGHVYLTASEKGLCGVDWSKPSKDLAKTPSSKAQKFLDQAEKQIQDYFAKKRSQFDLQLDVRQGTVFQKKVWKALAKIPYGQTCSYKDIAKSIKNAKAVRAVGSANGKNPLSLIVPCHRVIAADGSLGGYTGGLKLKKYLLDLENA